MAQKRTKRASLPEPQTEGERLLRELSDSHAAVGKRIGCSKQLVSYWRRGERQPDGKNRALLEKEFGIPVLAWACAAGTQLEAPAPTRRAFEPPPELGELSTLAHTTELILETRKMRGDEHLLPAQRARLIETETKLLAQKARLEREAASVEERIVREHPLWRRIRGKLLDTLRPFPDAARAVAEALQELDV